MSTFADTLKTLPTVNHLSHLELYTANECVARIENRPGQAGSLAVYAALADKYGKITPEAAAEGVRLYCEHSIDARANPGKHPNIDRLLALISDGGELDVRLYRQSE